MNIQGMNQSSVLSKMYDEEISTYVTNALRTVSLHGSCNDEHLEKLISAHNTYIELGGLDREIANNDIKNSSISYEGEQFNILVSKNILGSTTGDELEAISGQGVFRLANNTISYLYSINKTIKKVKKNILLYSLSLLLIGILGIALIILGSIILKSHNAHCSTSHNSLIFAEAAIIGIIISEASLIVIFNCIIKKTSSNIKEFIRFKKLKNTTHKSVDAIIRKGFNISKF